MSGTQLIMNPKQQQKEEQEEPSVALLDIYEAQNAKEAEKQDIRKEFFASLDFPCCGEYLEPKLAPIAEKKKDKGKPFTEGLQIIQSKKLKPYDGIYEHSQVQKQTSTDICRLKNRLVRDYRQEYFQQNGQFIVQKQLFHEQLSRLANISYQQNYAIRTYQKNAILCQRNNQKKSTPYQLQINIGCLWINNHQLQNQQQKKFEELRPFLRELNLISAYPILPELSKQLEYLLNLKQQLLQNQASQMQIQQIVNKIQIAQNMKNKQIDRVHKIMDSVIRLWKQVKAIRRQTQLETVPWRVNVKQYNVNQGRNSYDIGVTPLEISDKISGKGAQAQINRRQNIKKQKYFIRIYINGYQVAKSQKVNLQWPSFKVNFNQKFNITVYSAPSSVQVEIIKAGVINQSIDTISLALPGINSKTITSSEQRFAIANFALNGSKFRRKEQQNAQAPSGMVIYRIQWKGQGSRMPPVSFKSQQQQTAATEQDSQEDINYYEIYDMKDPRMQQKPRQQQAQDQILHSQAALLPFVDIHSARHLLLIFKNVHPEFEELEIPLLEQQIRKRQDLMNLIQNERIRNFQSLQGHPQEIYNPVQGIFKTQDQNIIHEIKQTLAQIQNIKNIAQRAGGRYKITEQIIDEYIFEQMESPIVVFCRNLFTQKRKLGPKVTAYQQARNNFDSIDINLHVRSARNMPIREDAFVRIRNFQEEQIKMNPMRMHQMAAHTGNTDMYANYGTGFYQRQPGMNLQGNNFFVPGMMNMGGGGVRPNLQANYQKKNLQRNSCYVQLRFKKILKRTDCFEGPFPQWNETLEFNYNMKSQGMNVEKMFANNQKNMKLLVYDMVQQSKPTTVIAEARIKKSKYFIGRIDIPMSMLVAIPSLSGLFKIERPLILFAYGIKKAGLFDFDQDAEEANKTQFPDIHTFINLDLFTDPLIDNMTAYNSDRKFVAGAESTLLLQRCSDWLQDLNTKRYIRLWLNNINGKSIFICRYLSSSIAPPPLGPDNLIERCARFVGMIPKKFSCKMLQNTEQFHLTCHEFLNVKMGEDHGILLCNYFNYIDQNAGRNHFESYLAIGKAFPYGKSIFVVRRDTRTNDVQVWDPYKGDCIFVPAKQYDTFCCFIKYPKKKDGDAQKQFSNMLQIGCLVSQDNVYINIQDVLKPEDVDFNIQDDKLWKPFLTQRTRTEHFERGTIKSIHNEITEDFYPRNRGIQSELQNNLFQYLRRNLQTQRKRHFRPYTFRVNSNVSNAVRNKILLECQTFKNDFRLSGAESTLYNEVSSEQKSKYGKALSILQDQKNQIKGLVDADKLLYGFTLNFPFTCYQDIWQKVQETHLHLDQTQSLEFVLAVKCFQLSCHVISVWIFVGSIA